MAINLRTKFKLSQGDVVGACFPNCPDFPLAALGIIEAGLIISTYNPLYTPEEVARQIVNSGTKVMICLTDNYKIIKSAVDMSKKDVKIICIKTPTASLETGAINFHELTNYDEVKSKKLPELNVGPNDTVFLPYSSGTTGMPKGVMLTHRNLISNAIMFQAKLGDDYITMPTTDQHQDTLLTILPLFHIAGWTGNFLARMSTGCKLVTLPMFKPETFLSALATHKPDTLGAVPPIVLFLGMADAVQPKHTDSLRVVISGAAPLGAKDVERFWTKAPHVKFIQGYGLTETSPITLIQAIGSTNFASVGSPTTGTQAKIIALDDPTMKGQGANVSGEILVRGPHIMKGYHNNETATKETIVKGGWLRTGDIGYFDDNGQFYITDRLKELIKVKGFQVAPAELEEVLRSHPAVADAAVIGVPCQATGEAPRGFIVPKPNVEVNLEKILEFAAEKLAVYKRLESVVMVEAIPKNATGKILRRELKKQVGLV